MKGKSPILIQIRRGRRPVGRGGGGREGRLGGGKDGREVGWGWEGFKGGKGGREASGWREEGRVEGSRVGGKGGKEGRVEKRWVGEGKWVGEGCRVGVEGSGRLGEGDGGRTFQVE